MAVSTRRRPMTNVDANLEAAATPITTEPMAGYDIQSRHAARMAELVRQGVPRQQAMEIAGREVIQAQSAEADARADARVQSGYRDPDQTAYNAETFAEGYGFDDNNQPAYLGPVDIGDIGLRNRATTVDRGYNFRDPRGAEVALNDLPHPGRPEVDAPRLDFGAMTAPGPQTLDGRPVRPPRPLNTPEEIEAYDVRPDQGLSQRDRDMALRGMVPVVTPNGVSYMRQYVPSRPQNDGYQIPGGPGRAGPRPDLEGKYEARTMVGPDGNPVQVLAPGPDMRAKQAANLAQRQEAYQVKKASMDERLQESRDLRRATAILARGSQNINSGNGGAYNQLAMMDDADRARALLYMSPAGRLAAEVDAGGARNAMRMMNADALAGMDPARQEERRQARVIAETGLPPAQRARISIANGEQMGEGGSAGHVAERWNYWTNIVIFPREQGAREQKFRVEMETLGYSPATIDAWIDQRRGAEEPLPMDGAPPGGYAEGPTTSW